MSFDWSAGNDSNFQPGDPLTRLGLTHVDTFRLEAQIGEGGMGVVYRAWDEAVGRPVAIKLMLAGARATEDQRKRFQRELQALGQLRHPALLTVHRSGEVQGIPYMVTEWLEGESLGDLVRRGPLPAADAVQILIDVAHAVAHAHAQGILHRDIKPDNVVLEPERGPVLLDFGLAKRDDLAASRITRSGTFAGTLAYAPPEQIVDASKVDERADVYSLGATLFCLLTGESPAERIDNMLALATAAAEGRLPGPCDIDPRCPRALDAIVRKAMGPEPADRYQSALELVDALERYLAQPRVGGGWGALRLAAAGSVVAAVVGVAFLAGRRTGEPPATAPSPSPSGSQLTSNPDSPLPTPAPEVDARRNGRLAKLHADLDALMVEVTQRGPINAGSWARHLRELRRLLSSAILTARAGGEGTTARAELGAALADAGRYPEALDVLRAGREAGDLRSQLTSASTRVVLAASRGELPGAILPWFTRIASGQAKTQVEERVITLAQVWAAHIRQRQPNKAEVRRQVVEATSLVPPGGSTPPWFGREVWIAAAAFMLRAPTPQARIDLAHPLVQLGRRTSSPAWSQAFTELWLRGWGPIRLTAPLFNRLELMVTHLPTHRRVEALARLGALCGLHGMLRRLDSLKTGVRMKPLRKVAEEVSARETEAPRGAKVVFMGRTAGLVLVPGQSKIRLLWEFPEGAWTLRLRGSEADLDLLVRHDAPPRAGNPLTLKSRSMARDEQVSSDPDRPTSGLHQIVIERSNPWPEPLAVDLELVPSEPTWTSPWDFTGTHTYPPGAIQRLQESRQLNLGGDLDAALAKVREVEREVPELILVRASMLSNAGAWLRLRQLQARATPKHPKIRRALAYEAGRVALLGGEPEVAEAVLLELLKREPHVLAAQEELALAQIGRVRLLTARKTLRQITKRDPSQAHAQTLLQAMRAVSERGDPVAKLKPLRAPVRQSARTRELVVRGLILAERPALALLFLEEHAQPREAVWRLEALIALKRTAEARALAQRLRTVPMAPFRKRRWEQLTALLKD